jgi:predicted ArsR family transcriptional regulator
MSTQNENIDLDAGKLTHITLGLKEGETKALDQIAEALGLSRNALGRYIIRRFLVDYLAGRVKIDIETKTTRSPKMP